VTREEHSPLYQLPDAGGLANYLLRIEQLLAVRCAGMDGVAGRLSGEREIIDGMIQLCLRFPHNVPARLLLVEALRGMNRVKPSLLPEFSEKIALLQKDQPLPEPAHGVVREMLSEVFPAP
jgi:hypothetical protein